MTFPCILCESKLAFEAKADGTRFYCKDCAFQAKAPSGYSLKQSFEYISNGKTISKSHKKSTGFPTRRHRRSQSTDSIEFLEEDAIINQNEEKTQSIIRDNGVPEVISQIAEDKGHQFIYLKEFKQSLPKIGPVVSGFPIKPILQDALIMNGIETLYEYQEEVFRQVMSGEDLIISAPTGTGKTEAFLVPILNSILLAKPTNKQFTAALLVYPTKALASDQFEKIKKYCAKIKISVKIYDGDTPTNDREDIYRNPPDILITNPDMIHYHLMGNLSFQNLIKHARFMVLDEIHLCVGSFGSNILWIIRRLRRFAKGLQCIGASATISNTQDFASQLFDRPTNVVKVGTARKSDLFLSILYPKERSNLSTMAKISEYFNNKDHQTLVFANGHLASESLNIILNKRGINSNIHRAGLSVKHRKSVEDKFRNGLLDVLVSTPTLELGIDIGSVDSVISVLTSLTHFVQRIGRAGRSGQKSFATLVLRGDDPISAYYARNPEDYLTELEPAFVEPNNEHVAYYQIISMLLDQPLSIKESIRYDLILDKLRKQKILHERKGLISLRDRKVGQILLRDFSIRGIGKSIKIISNNRQIGERSLPIALRELHTGAIYLHGGKSYKVQRLNTKIRAADLVQIKSTREKTQAMRSIWPEVKDLSIETNFNGLAAGFGKIELTETITGYVKKDIFTGKVLNQYELEEPISHNFTTSGFILAMPKPIDNVSSLSDPEAQYYLGGTYHAIEHVLIESGNSLTGGGANQIGGVSIGDTGLIFVYDGNEGGSGLSKLLFEKLSRGLDRSLTIMEQCPCKRDDGCPRCTYSYYCGNNNTPLNRLGAIETLKLVGKTSTELILDYDGVETFIVNSDFPPV